jgi:5-methylcytosine-specific restriction protein B
MKMFEKMQERFEKYKIIEEMEEELEEEDFAPLNYFSESTFPLNQILYGPPGTGKTYNTINKALEIINDDEVKQLDFNDRKAVKDLFDKKLKEGQIMFTTFHQSMSYEDFIEGIKPEIEEDAEGGKTVIYEVKKGIFKQNGNSEFILFRR